MPPGRPRKPYGRHQLEGTYREDRANLQAPEYEVKAVAPPLEVRGRKDALAEWRYIVPILETQRMMTVAFRAAVTCYCLAVADVREWERRKRGRKYAQMDLADQIRISRRLEVARREVRQWVSELGLSPTTVTKASKVQAPTGPQKSHLAAVLAGPGAEERR